MSNFARVMDGFAVDVSRDPAGAFVPAIAAEFVPVPDHIAPGWRLVAGEWLEPLPVVVPEPVPRLEVSVAEARDLFTMAEKAAIHGSDDARVKALLADMAVRSTINLQSEKFAAGMALLVGLGLLTAARADQIKAGEAGE